ncbi:MAG TPA: type IV secretion system protein [Flavobacterium sp.]|nr:type IV secretion system protein [Flavobacterium sp.]
MKKIIYLLMLIVSTLALNSAYAVENFTNSQDLGAGQVQTNQDGSITIPNTQNQEKQKMGDAVKSVSNNGMEVLNNVTERIAGDIDKKVKDQIKNYYVKITEPIIPVFAGFIIIWISFQSIKMMLGMAVEIQGVIATFVLMLLTWSIVFTWDSFFPYVAEVFLDDVPNLIGEMTGTDAVSTFQSFMTVILGAIALAFENVDTGITNAVSGFFFVLIYAGMLGLACIVCGLFFLIWIISKIIIAIILVVAPIFLGCAMFPATRRYATNWLQAILTPLVVLLLLIVSCDLILSTIVPIVDELNQNGSSFIGAFVMIITLIIVLGVFWLVPKIAISLVGSGFDASTSATTGLVQSLKKTVTKR